MLDAPFVAMLKVMIVCNKARISVGTDENLRTLSICRMSTRRKQSTPTVAKVSNAFQFPPTRHIVAVDKGMVGPVSSETGLHRRQRSVKVRIPSMRRGEVEQITITGNPSETALLRYCSRIVAVRITLQILLSDGIWRRVPNMWFHSTSCD